MATIVFPSGSVVDTENGTTWIFKLLHNSLVSPRLLWRAQRLPQSLECDAFDERRKNTPYGPRRKARMEREARVRAALAQARSAVGNVRMHDEHDPEL